MPNLSILNKDIRTFDGLYSLNDLHKASGGDKKHQPANFLRLETTKALVSELDKEKIDSSDVRNPNSEKDGKPSILKKQGLGTFVCYELVYAYANWISAYFYLKVIRYFHDGEKAAAPKLESPYISDEQLEHIKKGVGKMVHATGKHWQVVYRDLFDYVAAPSVREIKKERYAMACDFLGISTDFTVPADKAALLPKAETPKLPDGHAKIDFNVKENADYTVKVRNGKISRKRLMYYIDPLDEAQDWWLEA